METSLNKVMLLLSVSLYIHNIKVIKENIILYFISVVFLFFVFFYLV